MSSDAALHPDRLLPVDPRVRSIARRLYAEIRDLPLVCPHGHVSADLLLADEPFADPAGLLISPDHYVTRLLHASGVSLECLGVSAGRLTEDQARGAWRELCRHWPAFRGTAVRYWLQYQLALVFGVSAQLSLETADASYDQIATCLADASFRPRALARRFAIEVLATTDDPCDDLAAHAALADEPSFGTRVIPTFRPDRYLEPAWSGWADGIARLGVAAGVDTAHYDGFVDALERRRQYFIAHGATSADHGHLDAGTEPLEPAEAQRIYRCALTGEATAAEAVAFRRHMTFEMARMSVEDGLVMTLHPGVLRGHHRPTAAAFGPDTGHDIPTRIEFAMALRPLLERFGTHPNLHLVLFTVDETAFSRELAPLAGFYPSVFLGAPWWFLDAPEAMRRFRAAVTDTVGLSRSAGFVDDTRAFCSIPARHDMSRRIDAGFLATLVAEHRLDEDEALDAVVDLVDGRPRAVFRL